jgi:hypothetical protein
MKYLSILFTLIFTAGIATAQDTEVIMKERPGADLDTYESYAFGNNFINIEDNEWYSFGTLNSKMVQNAIVHEFDTYGYDLKSENPDVLVNYMIFDSEYNDKYGYYKDPYTVDQEVGQENILAQLEDGSLVVSMVNPDDGKSVWIGYAPDAIDPDDNLRQQQIDIRNAVADILETYMATANFDEYGK